MSTQITIKVNLMHFRKPIALLEISKQNNFIKKFKHSVSKTKKNMSDALKTNFLFVRYHLTLNLVCQRRKLDMILTIFYLPKKLKINRKVF